MQSSELSASKIAMLAVLKNYGEMDEIYFDVAQGLHWYCTDYYNGQGCELYRIQCELNYNPSPMENKPRGIGKMIYEELKGRSDDDCQAVLELIQETTESMDE